MSATPAPATPLLGRGAVLAGACLGLLALSLSLRLLALPSDVFNPDEFEHMHGAWCVSRGQLPYRDYFEHHTPLLHLALAPLVARFDTDHSADDAIALLLAARQAMWALGALAVGLTFLLARERSGWRAGAVSALLLALVGVFDDKAFEIRPDGLALVLLLGSWLAFLRATRRSIRLPEWSLCWSGGLLALATLATQKALFAWPAAGVLVAWLAFFEDGAARRGGWRRIRWWVAGLALPLALTAAFFASKGALGAFVECNLWLNARWRARVSPMPALEGIWESNSALVVLAALALLRALWRAGRGERPRSAAALPAMTLVSLLAGAFVIPIAYTQYFLMLTPLLAVLAAEALVFLAALAARPARAELLLAAALAGLGASPLQLRLASPRHPETRTAAKLRQLRFVLSHTAPDETLLDGFSGLGVFRPHAFRYFFVHEEIRAMLPDAQLAALLTSLRDGALAPRFVLLDRDLRQLDSDLLVFLRENYEPAGIGPIWQRKEIWIDEPPNAGVLGVGEGKTDVLVGHGFYPPSRENGLCFRLSRGRDSSLRLPLRSPRHARLVVRARREHAVPSIELSLQVNEREAGRVPLAAGWQDYPFDLSPSMLHAGLNRVRLVYSSVPRDDPGYKGRNAAIALRELRLED